MRDIDGRPAQQPARPREPVAGPQPDWKAVRRLFPGTNGRAYLDTATHGLAAQPTLEAVQDAVRRAGIGGARSATEDVTGLLDYLEVARREVATLIGASPDEIALVESTTHGLQVAAQVVDPGPGDRVLIDDLEFMGVVVPWLHLQRRRGFELVRVPHERGHISPEMFIRQAEQGARAIVLSSVQEVNGWRADLKTLGAYCRDRGICLVVDGIQHVGALPFDVRELPVDVLACGGHKWLTSPFGCGFVYVRREAAAGKEPALRGYLSVATPPEGWDRYLESPDKSPFVNYRFEAGASRFEIGGMPNVVGVRALAEAVGLLNRWGRDAIGARVRSLSKELADGLKAAGAALVSPEEEAHRSGVVVFQVAGGLDRLRRLKADLLAHGVLVSLRHNAGIGGMRASVHFYNDHDDIRALVDRVAAFGAG